MSDTTTKLAVDQNEIRGSKAEPLESHMIVFNNVSKFYG